MRISDQELKIISTLQLDADLALIDTCVRTKLKAHSIHYHLRRLRDQGIIRRGALINLPAMGYEQYGIYFSLAPSSAKDKARLLRELKRHPRVFWFAELGGDFQYGMSIIARRPDEALRLINSLSQNAGSQILRKSVSLIVNFSIFRKKYLWPKYQVTERDTVTLVREPSPTELDHKDYQILGLLADGQGESVQHLARQLGAPRTSVEYRIAKLIKARVLLRSIYYVSAAKLGFQSFKLLLYSRGVDPAFEKALFHFAQEHLQIVFFSSNLGSWDFEILAEVASARDAISITESIYEKFGTNIQDIHILPIFEQTTSSGFLKTAMDSTIAA